MKLEIKQGTKVQVLTGKFAGKEASVLFVDKKTKRVKLDGLKKHKVKTKKGESKELHGTFNYSHLKLIKSEEPKKEEPAKLVKAETKAPQEEIQKQEVVKEKTVKQEEQKVETEAK